MGNTMSFGTTENERLRVLAGAMDNITVDPRGTADLVMVIVISVVYGIDALAVVYMLWNRKYPPLKSKSPFIMAGFMAAAVLWFAGDIQVNGHAPLAGTPMTNCKAFGVWVRVLLGVCTLSALIALRSYGLYRVFCRNLPYNGVSLYLPFLIYCVCIVVYGIVSQVVSSNITIHYMQIIDICYYEAGYKASLFALLWATWILVALINWRIRKIRSSFNESREMLAACIAVFAILIFTTAMHYARPRYPLSVGLRIATTVLDHLATNVVWWLIMAVPMYQCLFHRKAYLDRWVAKLRRDGLQREYQVASASLRGTSIGDRQPDVHGSLLESAYLDGGMAPKYMGGDEEAYCYFNGGGDVDIEKHANFGGGRFFYDAYNAHLESAAVGTRYAEHKERPESPSLDASSESSLVGRSLSGLTGANAPQQQKQKQQQQKFASVQFSYTENASAPLRLNDANELHLAPLDGTNRQLL
ncbi:hypothetical protein IW140_005354 [Coemansia sp. RSA 1813]|nr:hypothetical protein EV178_005149 [Coemansia sp. RSA 1646]KAJ1769055.1 hypothetical protein LPJ74_004351 [Coemansia sp. RSA 1843]KAJ2086878.1 hypothetical protein IW138_005352 [Coemansia sp. RSA 986]KAJ2211684.1 hypothetical protein EV179_005300 [Coemansia sp. RSA 487]KAJ2565362.1 hypothetical protein IW140_005354 [Coemansia sp. RSA 1813]